MTCQALVTLPEHDTETLYLSQWASEAVLEATERGCEVKELDGADATRANLEKFLKKQRPPFLFFNGHGNDDAIFGHQDEDLVKAGVNEGILRDKIVYALACMSAAKLGPAAIAAGTKAYIGYEERFAFVTSKNHECEPDEDKLANIFKEASNEVPAALFKGATTKAAFERSQRKHTDLIRRHSTSDALPEWKDIRFWLFWNMKAQRLLGDPDATM